MKAVAAITLGAVLVIGGPLATRALASEPQGQSTAPGRGHASDRNSAAYQDGYNRGREDARDGRNSNNTSSRWHARHDRDAYAAGYAQGYQDARGRNQRADRDHDRDGDRDADRDRDRGQDRDHARPSRGGFGANGSNSAESIGYQDGLNDGAKDRQTGHSFRPTQGDNYKNASRGYNSGMGSKDQYKAAYRQGYAGGYQRGYYGR